MDFCAKRYNAVAGAAITAGFWEYDTWLREYDAGACASGGHIHKTKKPPWAIQGGLFRLCLPGFSSLRAPSACASACGHGGSIRRLHGRGARTAFRRPGGSSSHGTHLHAEAFSSARGVPGQHYCLVRLRTRSITPFGRLVSTRASGAFAIRRTS